MTALVRSKAGVTLIGGGAVAADELAEALGFAPLLVAADGGADQALALGQVPAAVIGDLDSVSDVARAQIAQVHHIPEQASTDFEKCLSRIDAPFVIAVGFSGQRLDHQLAALSVMARRVGPAAVMIAGEDLCFLAPPRLRLPLPAGERLSLFPMGAARGESHGLRWPIDGIGFAPDEVIGTSNQTLGPVDLTLQGPMLVMLSRRWLALVLAALADASGGDI
ncbi:MAG: thiamine diphosphokinase [Paracoccus sp. (in: a-proteobacteria)]|uniref:thiamine diphosphokinase n=1 Tax=Paracoccus sp. TaxID=267 RepID=UPI0026DFB1F8|nr:thiamine diphosphokinase [Paracoccus sp. (in: a-proteobacteria)]MDO5621952.1 thiamine diphosphokinase [Paracoccus sp. (in: a-proteobacteria)]